MAGAARVDLDGTSCGEVTAADQEHAAATLTEVRAAREAKRAAAAAGTRTAKQAAAVAPVSRDQPFTLALPPPFVELVAVTSVQIILCRYILRKIEKENLKIKREVPGVKVLDWPKVFAVLSDFTRHVCSE